MNTRRTCKCARNTNENEFQLSARATALSRLLLQAKQGWNRWRWRVDWDGLPNEKRPDFQLNCTFPAHSHINVTLCPPQCAHTSSWWWQIPAESSAGSLRFGIGCALLAVASVEQPCANWNSRSTITHVWREWNLPATTCKKATKKVKAKARLRLEPPIQRLQKNWIARNAFNFQIPSECSLIISRNLLASFAANARSRPPSFRNRHYADCILFAMHPIACGVLHNLRHLAHFVIVIGVWLRLCDVIRLEADARHFIWPRLACAHRTFLLPTIVYGLTCTVARFHMLRIEVVGDAPD